MAIMREITLLEEHARGVVLYDVSISQFSRYISMPPPTPILTRQNAILEPINRWYSYKFKAMCRKFPKPIGGEPDIHEYTECYPISFPIFAKRVLNTITRTDWATITDQVTALETLANEWTTFEEQYKQYNYCDKRNFPSFSDRIIGEISSRYGENWTNTIIPLSPEDRAIIRHYSKCVIISILKKHTMLSFGLILFNKSIGTMEHLWNNLINTIDEVIFWKALLISRYEKVVNKPEDLSVIIMHNAPRNIFDMHIPEYNELSMYSVGIRDESVKMFSIFTSVLTDTQRYFVDATSNYDKMVSWVIELHHFIDLLPILKSYILTMIYNNDSEITYDILDNPENIEYLSCIMDNIIPPFDIIEYIDLIKQI